MVHIADIEYRDVIEAAESVERLLGYAHILEQAVLRGPTFLLDLKLDSARLETVLASCEAKTAWLRAYADECSRPTLDNS